MRHLRLLSSTVPINMAALLLEDYVSTVLEDELHPSPFELGPTLQDLYDLEVDAHDDDPNEEAVNLIFPESLILQADIASEAVPTPLHTPTLSPIPELEEEDELDLRCYEEGFPPSDSEDEQGPVSEDESSPSEEDHPCPPELSGETPLQVHRPTPVRPSGERRAAVEKIEDLLHDMGGDEPLDLSLKRPRN
ncbi:early E1A 12S [Human mastadenovirus D]|uniref:Early E1A protein n=2 Tax=Human mastadenovirus D TaxID=130310 RepID=E5RVZ7_9ADEN|nr:early E1A 12S protein [Human mastadenovirus D]BAJ46336.1 early E1A 12S protein [Human adenovirus 53]BAJ46266.1 early E1A 12S protein [Human mastadenovirus D]BAJ46371.1 early E1A 12S protein [Human adenovirus 53]BAJ46407.1 early E1A 12S protein [Human adenovirus 53]